MAASIAPPAKVLGVMVMSTFHMLAEHLARRRGTMACIAEQWAAHSITCLS
jgi:hypothetical protein